MNLVWRKSSTFFGSRSEFMEVIWVKLNKFSCRKKNPKSLFSKMRMEWNSLSFFSMSLLHVQLNFLLINIPWAHTEFNLLFNNYPKWLQSQTETPKSSKIIEINSSHFPFPTFFGYSVDNLLVSRENGSFLYQFSLEVPSFWFLNYG